MVLRDNPSKAMTYFRLFSHTTSQVKAKCSITMALEAQKDMPGLAGEEVFAERFMKDLIVLVGTVDEVFNHKANVKGGEGLSLLELKNHLMVQYMKDLSVLALQKLKGESIKNSQAVWRLVENRTFIEKFLLCEEKVQYEMQKLVKQHHFGEGAEQDGLNFKPKMDNFNVENSDDEDEEDDSEEDEEKEEVGKKKKSGTGVYIPPKVAPMPYTGGDSIEDKEKKVKKRALSNAVMADLKAQYLDEPEEIVDSADLHRLHADRKRKEREEYEEKYMVRTSMSKKEKTQSRQLATVYSLDSVAKLNNYFGDEDGDGPAPKKRRSSSKSFKGKGKAKKGKKKRH